jgi:hypothetical protein
MWAFLAYEPIIWTYACDISRTNVNSQKDQSTKSSSKLIEARSELFLYETR